MRGAIHIFDNRDRQTLRGWGKMARDFACLAAGIVSAIPVNDTLDPPTTLPCEENKMVGQSPAKKDASDLSWLRADLKMHQPHPS
jgi:hypothetical protein